MDEKEPEYEMPDNPNKVAPPQTAPTGGNEASDADSGRAADAAEADPAKESGAKETTAPAGINRSELGKRILSGAVYAAVMILGLLVSNVTTVILIALVAGICAFEFFRMMHLDAKSPNDIFGIIAAVAFPICAAFGNAHAPLLACAMTLMALMLMWYVFYPRSRITDVALTVFGAMYCGLMLSCLVLIRIGVGVKLGLGGLEGGVLALAVVVSVWANDTCAYFVGSRFGRHKLAPKISPKKSWEGFYAGVAASVVIWALIPLIFPQLNLSYPWAIFAGIFCGVVAVFGDFTESRIKRGAGVKDSGTILPGHGGMLDRSDSLIFVSFAAYVVLIWAGVL